jgi:hypothetical protein
MILPFSIWSVNTAYRIITLLSILNNIWRRQINIACNLYNSCLLQLWRSDLTQAKNLSLANAILCCSFVLQSSQIPSPTRRCPTIVIMSMRDTHIHGKDEDSRIMMILDSLCNVQTCNGLNMQEIGNLDIAMSNHSARMPYTENRRVSGSQRVASLPSVAEVDCHEKHSYYSSSHEYRTLFESV